MCHFETEFDSESQFKEKHAQIQELQKETGCTIVINEDPVTEEGIVEILGTDQVFS